MSSDSDGVCVAVCDEPEDPDVAVAVCEAAPEGAGGASRQRGHRWHYPSEGEFLSWLLVDGSQCSPVALQSVQVARGLEALVADPTYLAGVGVVRCRRSCKPESPEASASHAAVVPLARSSGSRALGYIQYEIMDVFRFDSVALFKSVKKLLAHVAGSVRVFCS